MYTSGRSLQQMHSHIRGHQVVHLRRAMKTCRKRLSAGLTNLELKGRLENRPRNIWAHPCASFLLRKLKEAKRCPYKSYF